MNLARRPTLSERFIVGAKMKGKIPRFKAVECTLFVHQEPEA